MPEANLKKLPATMPVLIVDDEPVMCEMLEFDLRRKGLESTWMTRSQTVIQALKSGFRPQVIVTDVRMPDGSGFEILDWLYRSNVSVPVIFMTGMIDYAGELEWIQDAFDKGARAVFMKPFERNKLFEAITQALLPIEEKWQRKNQRENAEINLECRCISIEAAEKTHMLNLGQGGMFMATKGPLPRMGEFVGFRIEIKESGMPPIEGQAVVRWIRDVEKESMPRGVGLEFIELSDISKKQIIVLLNRIKTNAFIPKC